jgi:hypothetical protein
MGEIFKIRHGKDATLIEDDFFGCHPQKRSRFGGTGNVRS